MTGGDIDLYFANAGVFQGFGLDADEAEWAASWDVNVMAHVRAARLLVPRWVERAADGQEGGCFVSTASAAGLLVQLGSATYTHQQARGARVRRVAGRHVRRPRVQVCCLCPMGVRTQMIEGGDTHDNPDARLGHAVVSSAGEVMAPLDVADVLLDAVTEGRFLALPHPEVDEMQQDKAADRDRLARRHAARATNGGVTARIALAGRAASPPQGCAPPMPARRTPPAQVPGNIHRRDNPRHLRDSRLVTSTRS